MLLIRFSSASQTIGGMTEGCHSSGVATTCRFDQMSFPKGIPRGPTHPALFYVQVSAAAFIAQGNMLVVSDRGDRQTYMYVRRGLP